MAFLTTPDYSVQIRSEIMAIINQTNLSQEAAERMAQSQIIKYLRPRGYDVAAIFAATGTNRNDEMIMLMIDLVLYHLHSSIVTRAMPKTREDRYNEAIATLRGISRGELDPDLPKLPDGEDTPTIKLGSNIKYSTRW